MFDSGPECVVRDSVRRLSEWDESAEAKGILPFAVDEAGIPPPASLKRKKVET